MKYFRLSNKITNRDSALLDIYLQEIARHPLLTNEQESSLVAAIRQGSEQALASLIQSNLRFVVSVAKQFQNTGIPLSDLINEGNIGLIRAAKKFDGEKGFKFISYAVWWIRQAILQSVAEQGRLIKLPLLKQMELQKINHAIARFEQLNGVSSSAADIAAAVGIEPEKIESYHRYVYTTVSTNDYAHIGEEGNSIGDNLMDEEESIEDKLTSKYLYQLLSSRVDELNEREKYIIKNYYGIENSEEKTLEEIGSELAITRERVRQIKDRALIKLRSGTTYQMAV